MIIVKRTTSDNIDFQNLAKALDESLGVYYKDETSFYEVLNTISKIQHTVVAYNEEGLAVGCGGIKKYSEEEIELKRMFVPETYRGKGIATVVLTELENWSKELRFKKCILETLKAKPYAIGFYKKNGYQEIPNYGDYVTAENSICFKKEL